MRRLSFCVDEDRKRMGAHREISLCLLQAAENGL